MKYTAVVLLSMLGVSAQTQPAQPGLPMPRAPRMHDPALGAHLAEAPLPGEAAILPSGDDKDDPGYKLYRGGYNLIFDEKWDEARKAFSELLSKFPKSVYRDDARYWTAYALKHTDKKKAEEAYKTFIKDYPKSKYYDDAIGDLGDLYTPVVIATPPAEGIHVGKGKNAYSFSFAPNIREMERQVRRIEHMRIKTPRPDVRVFRAPMALESNEDLDPDTRLKLEAIYALGNKEDESTFFTLRDVALDQRKNLHLRHAAMDALADFTKFDVLPVYLEIAKKDTLEEIQGDAISYIGTFAKDKDKTVSVLVELFNATPPSRTDQLSDIFYSIAEVGNDRAVDFLAKIAKSHNNYELRSDALHYLGNIGTDRARAAIIDLLKEK